LGETLVQSSSYVIAVGAFLIFVALLRRTSAKGNFFRGISIGKSVQNYTESTSAPPAAPDKVVWAIGIVGVLATIAGIFMAHYDVVTH
jgi:hypothetical protein